MSCFFSANVPILGLFRSICPTFKLGEAALFMTLGGWQPRTLCYGTIWYDIDNAVCRACLSPHPPSRTTARPLCYNQEARPRPGHGEEQHWGEDRGRTLADTSRLALFLGHSDLLSSGGLPLGPLVTIFLILLKNLQSVSRRQVLSWGHF